MYYLNKGESTMKRYYDKLINNNGYKKADCMILSSYSSCIFIKRNKDTVYMYLNSYGRLSVNPLAILKKDYYIMNDIQEYSWKYRFACQKGVFKGLYMKWVRNGDIFTFANRSEIICYNNIKIDYNGNPYGKHPQKYIDKYNELIGLNKSEISAQSRSRYHNIKAIKRMNDCANPNGEGFDISKLPMDDVFKLWNVSHRRLIIDYYGMDTIIASLNSKTINRDVINGNCYELIAVEIPENTEPNGIKKATYLRMVNPSTDEVHFEGVANYNESRAGLPSLHKPTVKSALAWRNNDVDDNYNVPIILT